MPAPSIDVLIPTCGRPAALAVTLTGLASQTHRQFRVVISDQTEPRPSFHDPVVQGAVRVLRALGHDVETHAHLPRRGMAEQRQFLLERSRAGLVLYLDDDLILEPYVLEIMANTIQREECGFVGCAPIGLSYAEDVRPHEQSIQPWHGPVLPERVSIGDAAWQRHLVHNGANLWHVQRELGITPQNPTPYKVAWVGGCVLFNAEALREAGGFDFWRDLPDHHCGEDVLAQLRVMAARGGCGLMPSGVYHLELPTTLPDRRANAPEILDW